MNEQADNPEFIKAKKFSPTSDYHIWIKELKSRVIQYQAKAAVKVNTALLQFYWQLGHDITLMKTKYTWGDGFFNQLNLDLREAFPSLEGFSVTNIKYIYRWYCFYNQDNKNNTQIRHQAGDELTMLEIFNLIPWRHQIVI